MYIECDSMGHIPDVRVFLLGDIIFPNGEHNYVLLLRVVFFETRICSYFFQPPRIIQNLIAQGDPKFQETPTWNS